MRALLIGVLAVVVLAVAAPAADAMSCAVPRLAPALRAGDAAFVGRLVNATPDRWIFAVDESVKGGLGPQVEVYRPAPLEASTMSFTPQPGVQEGWVLVRRPDGVFGTNDCLRLTPAQLRLAAANPDVTCWRPRITTVRFRQPGRIDIALGGLDDPRTSVRVDWGDGRASFRAVPGGGPRRTVTVRHSYDSAGRRSLRVQAISHPVALCGGHQERTARRSLVVQT